MLQEKTNLFKTSIILARTRAQKINDIGSNIDNQLKNKANISEYLSLALDELKDITETKSCYFYLRRQC